MPSAPRQGRKGGKISSSPAIAGADTTPLVMSPSTLPAATCAIHPVTSNTASATPTPPTLRETGSLGGFPSHVVFDLETLLDHKRAAHGSVGSTNVAGVDAVAANGAIGPTTTTTTAATATSTMTESNVLKIDLDAITQIGQGVVIGGNKTVRTDLQPPCADGAVVRQRLRDALAAHEDVSAAGGALVRGEDGVVVRRVVPAGLAELATSDVVIVRSALAALALAVAVSTHVADAVVVVVVPHFFDVAPVAESLRRMAFVEGGAPVGVGEFAGRQYCGAATLKLWVTSAESAFCLYGQPQLPPFTHVVIPGLAPVTPLLSCFMLALRARLQRWGATAGHDPVMLRWVVHPYDGNVAELHTFFAALRVHTTSQFAACPDDAVAVPVVQEFSYDEAHALAAMDILDVREQEPPRPSRRGSAPHGKLIEHLVQLAARVVRHILDSATGRAQRILVVSPEVDATVAALRAVGVAETSLFVGQLALATGPSVEKAHHVYVMSRLRLPCDAERVVTDFVLDLGCARRPLPQSRRESLLPVWVTEWALPTELQERRGVLGVLGPGVYMALYPTTVHGGDAHVASLMEVEGAVLRCVRAGVPMEYVHAAFASLTAPSGENALEDALTQAMTSLREKVLLNAEAQPPEVTFVGELAARLPLSSDLAQLVVHGCALGMAEVAVVMAALSTLPCRVTGSAVVRAESGACVEWAERVLASRRRAAGAVAQQSDLLADVLLFLEWCTLRARGESTRLWLSETAMNEGRLERLRGLVHYCYAQLSDYVFVDERGLDEPAVVAQMTTTVRTQSTLLIFVQGAALARHLVLLRGKASDAATEAVSSLYFVRTAKRVVNAEDSPTNVPCSEGEGALVATCLRNTGPTITGACWSAIQRDFYFAALLLLYPVIEYSAPVEVGGAGRLVYMGVMCNRHMRRFRLAIEDAAKVLDFREQLNRALDVLQALRVSPRNLSRRRFVLELKRADPLFDLDDLQQRLRTTLVTLATELDVMEHQGTFETFATHTLATRRLPDQQTDMGASDVIMAQRFCSGELWRKPVTVALASPTTPKAAPASSSLAAAMAAISPLLSASVFVEDDEDDIEIFGESYFAKFGPILDDDDE